MLCSTDENFQRRAKECERPVILFDLFAACSVRLTVQDGESADGVLLQKLRDVGRTLYGIDAVPCCTAVSSVSSPEPEIDGTHQWWYHD